MAQGAYFGGACHASQAAALDAYYGSSAPAVAPGGTSYLSEFVKVSGAWMMRRYQIDSLGQLSMFTDAAAPVVVFPECDPMQSFNDGMTVGWGLVGAMVVAAGIVAIKRALS